MSVVFHAPLNDAGAGVVNTALAIGAFSPTFTRATPAWTILSDGTWGLVASGSPRSCYSPSGVYLGYLAEPTNINLCLQSQNFAATWVPIGTPTLSSSTTILGALALSTIGDDSGAAVEGYGQVIAYTGDASKSVSVAVKKGTSTSSVIRMFDETLSSLRLLAAITWSGLAPVVAMTAGTDITGTPVQHGNSGVYRLFFRTTSITAASSNRLQILPATTSALASGNTGTIEIGGIQTQNSLDHFSIIVTTTGAVTRDGDYLTYDGKVDFPSTMFSFETAMALGNVPSLQHAVICSSTSGDDGYALGRQDSALEFAANATVKIATVAQALVNGGVETRGATHRIAGRFASNNVNVAINGVAGTTDTSVGTPTLNGTAIGSTFVLGNGHQPTSCLRGIKIDNTAFTDAQLVALTSPPKSQGLVVGLLSNIGYTR